MKTYKKKCTISLLFVAFLLLSACVPPMRFSSTIDVPSPDGKTSLEVSSVAWTDFGLLIGPEPPSVTSCTGFVSGRALIRGTYFKIDIDANFKPSTSAHNHLDVVWSPDSKYFAVTTPLDITIYDRDGNIAGRYELGSKKRVSTVHWKKGKENVLYAVVKERVRDLLPLGTFFHPSAFTILYAKPNDNKWKSLFFKSYLDGSIESDWFVPNNLGAKRFGEEFQEISPDSKYFIYIDEKKVHFYDLEKGDSGIFFDAPDSLSWVWWINTKCILFEFYLLRSSGMKQYIIYNVISGKKKDVTEQINLLPPEKWHTEEWYKSLACP